MSAEPDDAESPAVVPQQILPAPQAGASPVTPEVLKEMMGGPPRTPLEDTMHKVSVIWVLGRAFPSGTGQLAHEQPRQRRRPALWVGTGLTGVAGYLVLHFDWIPFLN